MSNWKYKLILRNKDNSIIPAKRIFILFLYSFGATTLLPGDYNSNSLASTLLQKIGLSDRQIEAIDEKLPGTLVGWGKYLQKSAFKE